MPLGIVKNEDYERTLGNTKETNPPKDVTKEKETPPRDDETSDMAGGDKIAQELGTIFNQRARGRGNGNTQVPDGVRKIIGEAAIEEGSGAASAIGQFLGLSQSAVSAYQKGATSTTTYDAPKPELIKHLNATRERISKRASGKLMKALNVIDDDKLGKLDAVQASTVAKNMSAIVKHMEPESAKAGNTINGPVITFYAPHMVKEEIFDVVTVQE